MPDNKKALLVTTVSGFVPQFEMNNVKLLQNLGYEVHYASNYHTPSYGNDNHRLDGTGIIRHQIDFVRSPFKPVNLSVYRQLRRLMREEHFDLVHCHTPMGGVMARLAAHATHTGPVIYTAHGFHFFKGAKLINWLCYYPMEKFLSRYTDQQICINKEDYLRAKKHFHSKHVNYIPGVGIDFSKIPSLTAQQIEAKRRELGLTENQLVILSAGELIKRKNHETALRAMAELKKYYALHPDESRPIHYIICGHGELESDLKKLAETLGLEDTVSFLGYRTDMLEIYQAADLFLFPSFQEGLPMALLEAMASGLPVICSDIRGSRDLMGEIKETDSVMKKCAGGMMITKADDSAGYTLALGTLLSSKPDLTELGKANVERSRQFGTEKVTATMNKIYKRLAAETKENV